MDSAEAMWVCPLYAHCDWPLSTSGLAIGVPSRLWNVAQCQLNACREVAFKQRRRHLPKAQQGAHSQRCAAIGPSLYPVR